jgi:hypothetical protein
MMRILTPVCFHCGLPGYVMGDEEGYASYMEGAYVQVAFPEMSVGEREQLVSGTHPGCWDKMFPESYESSDY